ncbi:MAG: hypothetical protein ACTSXF_15880, partial [Promethearchaeota archaeon]
MEKTKNKNLNKIKVTTISIILLFMVLGNVSPILLSLLSLSGFNNYSTRSNNPEGTNSWETSLKSASAGSETSNIMENAIDIKDPFGACHADSYDIMEDMGVKINRKDITW